MDKNYNHETFEKEIYQRWLESGVFVAPSKDEVKNQKTFSIIMPPPNANEALHVGHALFVTIEDILARYHRMKGEAVLWQPGTDHAGIETQVVFEKKLAKDGKSRFDYGREELYKLIWDYTNNFSHVAVDQMKSLGASADWSRLKFTLDEKIVDMVLDTFIKLHEDGLVYRAQKLVNYCTRCGTAYSELEVEHEEKEDMLYFIKYDGITVATTRPETLFGDIAVAVNPNDKRYKNLIGKSVKLPLTDRMIPVVADEMVDMEFGTGAVKITPAHDPNDWAVAERLGMNLEEIVAEHTVIGTNGKLKENTGDFAGLNVTEGRAKVVEALDELLVEAKPYTHSVGTCYRCHRVIEPLPVKQFFVKVKPLAEKSLMALDKGETVIFGAGREEILRHWLNNLRDWNISRQIVWGIRMPVWYKDDSKTEFVVSKQSPGEGWIQETDSFDTWFSSGQWPVLTLKAGKPGDFETYYPTDVMETGYDILPIWVLRMMLLCIYLTNKSPFKQVYLHGLVRDEKGQKMSKSKGNSVNPLELTTKYGTDSLRMALVMSTVAGQDSNTGEAKVRGMRNFANKIWNAARYVKDVEQATPLDNLKDDEMRSKLGEVTKTISNQLDKLMVGLAAETTYNEFWHWYCDEVIEQHKKGEISKTVLEDGLKTFLKLLHPFVPFVTEAVWHEMGYEDMVVKTNWPT